MAGHGGAGDSQATWRAMVTASYFTIPQGECRTCRHGRKCGNHFCVECKMGGLCESTFQLGGDHAQHPNIQVYMVTYNHGVRVVDLRRFMPRALVDQIQLYSENNRRYCKFFKPDTRSESPRLRKCHGCGYSISATSTTNRSASPVCSLECLLDHALARRVDFLIAAIDSMPGEWDRIAAANQYCPNQLEYSTKSHWNCRFR